jgi:hypothetical protein
MLANQKLMKTYQEPMQEEVLAYWAEHGVKKELFDLVIHLTQPKADRPQQSAGGQKVHFQNSVG